MGWQRRLTPKHIYDRAKQQFQNGAGSDPLDYRSGDALHTISAFAKTRGCARWDKDCLGVIAS